MGTVNRTVSPGPRADAVAEQVTLSDRSRALLQPDMPLVQYLRELARAEQLDDAFRLLVEALPTPECLWWLVLCSWSRTIVTRDEGLEQGPVDQLRRAVVDWLHDPTESKQQLILAAAASAHGAPLATGVVALLTAHRIGRHRALHAASWSVGQMVQLAAPDRQYKLACYMLGVGVEVLLGNCHWQRQPPTTPRPTYID
jgi:hypothetical protein